VSLKDPVALSFSLATALVLVLGNGTSSFSSRLDLEAFLLLKAVLSLFHIPAGVVAVVVVVVC
jgi:hypothetical protein